jgi:hypothetical protein
MDGLGQLFILGKQLLVVFQDHVHIFLDLQYLLILGPKDGQFLLQHPPLLLRSQIHVLIVVISPLSSPGLVGTRICTPHYCFYT